MGWQQNVFTQLIIEAITSGSGLFVYSGVPADGNLIYSIAAAAGTDSAGNAYLAGATSYGTSGAINENGGALLVYSGSPAHGNLIVSIAAESGTDGYGNAYPEGFGLTTGQIPGNLINPGSIQPTSIASLTASLLGNLGVLNANPYFWGGDGTGWNSYQGTFAVTSGPPAGAPYKYAGKYVNNGVSAGAMEESSAPFPIQVSTQYLVTAWVYSSVATVTLGFDWLNSSQSYVSTSAPDVTVTPDTWTQITTVQTSPASGVAYAYPRIGDATADGATIYAQAITVLPQVPGTLIEAGTVTATQIAAGTITAALLVANIVVAGIVDGTLIEGAQFVAYGATGEILVYSSTPALGNLIFSVSANSGTDGYGNTYLAGMATYGPSGTGTFSTAAQLQGGELKFYGNGTIGVAAFARSPDPGIIQLDSGNEGSGDGSSVLDINSAGNGGFPEFVSGLDGNEYDLARLTLDATANPQTISSTGATTITGCSAPVASGVEYKFHARVMFKGGTAAGTASFSVTGPELSSGWIQAMFIMSNGTAGVGNQTASLGAVDSPTLTTANSAVDIIGEATFSAAGTIALACAEGTSGDTVIIEESTFDLYPVIA